MLISLFASPELNKYENLVVNQNDQFSKYEPMDDRLGEVNSGSWYQNAYQNCIEDNIKIFLCPSTKKLYPKLKICMLMPYL